MSDGIAAISPALPTKAQAVQESIPAVKIVSLPPDLPPNIPLRGEVAAIENGQIAIQTELGTVILEGDVPVELGQKLNISIKGELKNPQILLELLSIKSPPASGIASAPVLPGLASDMVRVHAHDPIEVFSPLALQMASLPKTVSPDILPLVLKAMLGLPANTALPPALQEGLDKLQQLTSLVSQTKLPSALELASPPENTVAPDTDASALFKAMRQFVQADAKTVQSFVQLQALPPGQNLSPNILVEIRQQLVTLTQSQPPQIPIAQIAVPAGQPIAPPPSPAAMFSAPAINLVLGAPQSQPSAGDMMLSALPDGDQPQFMVSLSAPKDTGGRPLLPGTILITAFQPQLQNTISVPALLSFTTPEIFSQSQPLHSSLGETWPALADLWQQALNLKAIHPEILASLQQTLPAPSQQHMPPAMLFLLSVLKHNLPWIGEKSLENLPQAAKEAILAQLSKDVELVRARNDDTAPGDIWRPLPMPLQIGDQLLRLQWFYRHPQNDSPTADSGEDGHKDKKRKTRFLLNVPKTGLGDIQIDGMVQEQSLEIILRTERQVTSRMETAIRARYHSALETTGIQGMLHFQSGRELYVRV